MRRAPAPVLTLTRVAAFAVAVTAMLAVAVLALAGCGDGSDSSTRSADTGPAPEALPPIVDPMPRTEGTPRNRAPAQTVAPSHCPAELSDCRTTKGRIIYVERLDPDGDGDAHFVLTDPQGITLPGLTVVDVRAGLRPQPLPGPGDLVSAAGQVQTGSYGQDQIHAVEVHAGVPRDG